MSRVWGSGQYLYRASGKGLLRFQFVDRNLDRLAGRNRSTGTLDRTVPVRDKICFYDRFLCT